MSLYCGIDLHSNNHVLVVIDEQDRRVLNKRLANDVSMTVDALAPYRAQLAGIAIESTFNWYWLVDGLEDAGYAPCLANPAAIKQYEGLKHTDDVYDAFFLAQLMRLGILPTGCIYPRLQRGVRDCLRRRLSLLRMASSLLLAVQSQIWRSTGIQVSNKRIRRADFDLPLPSGPVREGAAAQLKIGRCRQARKGVGEKPSNLNGRRHRPSIVFFAQAASRIFGWMSGLENQKAQATVSEVNVWTQAGNRDFCGAADAAKGR